MKRLVDLDKFGGSLALFCLCLFMRLDSIDVVLLDELVDALKLFYECQFFLSLGL